jgi:hypothetical protein
VTSPPVTATAWDLDLQSDGSFAVLGSTLLIPGETSEAYAITDTGDVRGILYGTGNNKDNAFVIRDGSLQLLPAGSPKQLGIGFDLNDTEVVGATGRYWYSPPEDATKWSSNGRAEDLLRKYFDASWSQAIADGINDAGVIVGFGNNGGEDHAWLLRRAPATLTASTAVPEPSNCILATISVMGALACRRRILLSREAEATTKVTKR